MSGFLAFKIYENAKKTSLKLPPLQARLPRHSGEHGTSAEREQGVTERKSFCLESEVGPERTR